MGMSFTGPAQFAKVEGRDDIGAVIQAGKNLGTSINVNCYVILFPTTGEVRFYDSSRITLVDEHGQPT